MAYEILRTDTFARDLKKLDKKTADQIRKALHRIIDQPGRQKPLKGLPGYYRLRVGVYRIIYKLEGNKFTLLFIKKRDTAYKKA